MIWLGVFVFAEQEEAHKFESAARKFCHSLRVTVTDTGVVGLVPRCTQKRDVVVVVERSQCTVGFKARKI
jgi:hypothetical protein